MPASYPTPSAEDIATANAIIARTVVGHKNRVKYAKGDFETAGHLSKKYTGYRPTSPCNACALKVFDNLRAMVGMTFARKPLPEDRVEARKSICHACPAYHPNTDSCGRLIIDALSSRPVTIEGVDVFPCGCIISLKSLFRSEQCPGNFWPAK